MPKPSLKKFEDFAQAGTRTAEALVVFQKDYPDLFEEARPFIEKAIPELHDQGAAVEGFSKASLEIGAKTILSWCRDHPAFALRLLRLNAKSSYLGELLLLRPGLLEFLVKLPHQAWGEGFLPAGVEFALSAREPSRGFSLLRRLKTEAVFRLGLLDLEGLMEVSAVTHRLSELADQLLAAALELAWRDLWFKRSKPVPGPVPPMAVLAMGKHGGGELNYLSDVDLIFVFDENLKANFPHGLDQESGYTALAEKFLEELSQTTPDGVLWRTDMRLRPEGDSGPLVSPLESALVYYESDAAAWELLAMSRGRFIVGHQATAQKVLDTAKQRLQGLVRYSDVVYQLVEQRFRMKDADTPESPNLKTGFGGIRDVEWASWVLGAIGSLKNDACWPGQTVQRTLEALGEMGLLSPDEAKLFLDNYLWLRQLEHLAMLKSGRKIHELPSQPEALGELANSMGMEVKTFLKELARRRQENRTLYHVLFPAPPASHQHWLVDSIRDGKASKELQDWMGPQTAAALKALSSLKVSQYAGPHYSALIYDAMAQAGDSLVSSLKSCRSPLRAMERLHHFQGIALSRQTFWRSFAEQSQLRASLVGLAAASAWASRVLATHPEYLDQILLAPTESFRRELLESVSLEPEGFDRYKFVMVAHGILGGLRRREVETGLSHAADKVVLAAASEQKAVSLVLGAFGKWGQEGLLPGSDLDFVFFSPDSKNMTLASKKAQKLLGRLTDHGEGGPLFEADARLRPFGTQGELVISLEEARAYYKKVELWERLIWVSARGLGKYVKELEALRSEVLSVKKKSEGLDHLHLILRKTFKEKNSSKPGKKIDIKYSPGGLLHLETLGAWLAFQSGLWTTCRNSLDILQDLAPAVVESYDFLREVAFYLRIAGELPQKSLMPGTDGMAELAGAMGFDQAVLLERVQECLTIGQEVAKEKNLMPE